MWRTALILTCLLSAAATLEMSATWKKKDTTDFIAAQTTAEQLDEFTVFYLEAADEEDEEAGWVEAGYMVKRAGPGYIMLDKENMGSSMGQANTCEPGSLDDIVNKGIRDTDGGCSLEETDQILSLQQCYLLVVRDGDQVASQTLPEGCNKNQSVAPPACLNFNYNEEALKTGNSGGTTSLTVTNFNIKGAVAKFICKVRLEQYGSPTSLANNMPPTTVAVHYNQNGGPDGPWTHLYNLNHKSYNSGNGKNKYKKVVHPSNLAGINMGTACFKCEAISNGQTDTLLTPTGNCN